MYADFFREDKHPRLSNLTFASSNVMASMMYPKIQIEQSINHQRQNSPKISLDKISSMSSPSKIEAKNESFNQKQVNSSPAKLEDRRSIRNYSHLSSYGTSSLKKLPRMLSDRDVQNFQSKDFNIINNDPISSKKKIVQQRNPNKIKFLNKERDQDIFGSHKVFNPEGYNGISTVEQNRRIERINKIISRPYYLNNADEIYL